MLAPTSFFADYGCHVRILEEARVLKKLGHQVTVATYHNGGPAPELDIVRTLPIPWRRDYEVGSSKHKVVFDALLGLKTTQLLMQRRFDVIHAHLHEGALIGLILGRLFGLPVLFDFQGSMTAEMVDHHFLRPSSPFYKPLLRLEKWLDKAVGEIVTSSAHARRSLIDTFGCAADRVTVLPDAVNADVFCPREAYSAAELERLRVELAIPPGRRLVVYLGLFAEYQGVGLLLQAMHLVLKANPQAHLLMMGFPNLEHYQNLAFQLGIREHVTFTGRMPYHLAPAYLALGDVAAAPKISMTEGAGKLLNYMSAALPVVAFDTPVAREYLGTDGTFVPPGDVVSLAQALEAHLLVEPALLAQLQAAGRRLRARAQQLFSWDKAGMELVEVYDRLCEHRVLKPVSSSKWSATGR
jgi:glycosyltransferase involved in cell wall biosynthesis